MTDHQQNQVEVINQIEEQIRNNSLKSSTVSPVIDYKNDPRICLTSVHFPNQPLKDYVRENIIEPLRSVTPEIYYYPKESLHLTIKNIRVINNPPTFTFEDIKKAQVVFSRVIPKRKKFKVFFYRLLLFPSNLALIGTTEPELDKIILDLDYELEETGIPDDKKYVNSKYFFCNMTLARFNKPLTQEFKDKIKQLSKNIKIDIYTIDSVSLIASNSVLNNLQIIDTWKLK